MEQIIETIKKQADKTFDGEIRNRFGQIKYEVTCRKCHQKAKQKHSINVSEQRNQYGKITRLHLPKFCKR